jgi:hypothetical protein
VGKYESPPPPVLRVACLEVKWWCTGDADAGRGIGGRVLGGGSRREGGSGEQDDARDAGLPSSDGVGGSRD